MKARELLLECKVALNVSSDYALAAALKIPRERISNYMKGERIPDEYACFRIAEALGREPSEVIAEIRAETDAKHGEFWRDFLQRRGLVGLAVGASLLSYSVFYTPEAAAAEFLSTHNVYYVKCAPLPELAIFAAFLAVFTLCLFAFPRHNPPTTNDPRKDASA